MKVLKWLLAGFFGLAAVIVVVGFFLPSRYTVTRSTSIKASPEQVYALVADPRAWKQWSAWNKRDPQMQITYSGPETGVGAAWAWKSESQGDGEMKFTGAEPGRLISYELYFPEFESRSTGEFQLKADGELTQVQWRMDGDMGGNPVNRWFGLLMDGMIGGDFEEGLRNLKSMAEKPSA